MHLVGYLYEHYHDARSLEQEVISGFALTTSEPPHSFVEVVLK